MFIYQSLSLPRRTFLRGMGTRARATAARRHGPGALGDGHDAGDGRPPDGIHLPAQRRGDELQGRELLEAERRQAPNFEFSPILQAARRRSAIS